MQMPCSICGGSVPAQPTTQRAWVYNPGVYTSNRPAHSYEDTVRSFFLNCWLFRLIFYLVQNMDQGGEVPSIGPLQRLAFRILSGDLEK